MFPISNQNDGRTIYSIENNSIIGSAPIQIPNNNFPNSSSPIPIDHNNNTNNTKSINQSQSNSISNSQNHVAVGNEHSFQYNSFKSNNNKLEASIPIGSYPVTSSSTSSSYILRNENKPMISKSITINSERTFENSVSSSFKSPLHNTFIPNSFDSATIDNNFVNHLNNTNQLFSGSLPVGSFNSSNNTNLEENLPQSNTKYIEEVNTNTTTTPTQYYKDHQDFHRDNNTNSDTQINLDYVVNPTTSENPYMQTKINNDLTKIEGISEETKPLLNIADFPTEDLLKMLTALLEKIVNSNDEINTTSSLTQSPPNSMENDDEDTEFSVSCFYGKHVPQISIEQYLLRIQKYCPTTNDIFLSLLVYFDRISKKCNNNNNPQSNTTTDNGKQNFVMDSYNIHRLLISAVAVSTKFFSDFFYSNARYARVGGIPLQEMNKLEIQFMILCDFKLLIPVDELQRYADLLYTFWTTHNEQHDQSQTVQFNNDPNDTHPSFTSERMTT